MDEILLFNISDVPDDLAHSVFEDVGRIRSLDFYDCDARGFLENQISLSYDLERKQVNGRKLIDGVNSSGVGRYTQQGKVILINEDLYYPGVNWCFGGFTSTTYGLGYILLSTARSQSLDLTRDLLSHEVGHMFGVPSSSRLNIEESLGGHCLNDLCVMQQKLSVSEALSYAKKRANSNVGTYCSDCERDIYSFEPR